MRVFGLLLPVCAFTGWAQTADRPLEAGVSYSYTNLTTSDTAQSIQSGASAFALYFFKPSPPQWGGHAKLAVAVEFGGSGSGSGSLYTYLAGFRWGTEWRQLYVYGGSEAGGARVRVNGTGPDGASASYLRDTFASSYALAGVDLLLGRYVVKLLQAEDLAFQTPDPANGKTHWQGGLRVSAGVALRFGRRP